ncbi:MAG: DUF1273 family protein [Clostridia bacterium]|nr:DUF1273 family protein [Clostridia bacterium]
MGRVSFTGYRPEKLPFCEGEDEKYLCFRKTLYKVIKRLAELGYTDFISGIAMGFDTWVAEDVLALKKEVPEVTLECAVPFPEQADKWPREDKIRRSRIIESSDNVVVTSLEYTKSAYFKRNRYMVDNSEVVVCCYDGKSGGTAYTVEYARKEAKTVIQINPTDMVVTVVSGKP